MSSFRATRARTAAHGFTLVELMITIVILAVVTISLGMILNTASRSRTSTSNSIESIQSARAAMEMITDDLRSAGFGADIDYTTAPQPPIAYIDSVQVLINSNVNPYPDTTAARHLPPLAYNPSGSPRPKPLDGTAYAPPIKYRSGAELIRWTIDVNNDGSVSTNDNTATEGLDASRTKNPNDFVLIRQVYGDSTNNTAGNNGGAVERVALVRKPGGTARPMFTVYLKDSATPWKWADGPVPVSKLRDIQRVVVEITGESPNPNWRGKYASVQLRSEVNSFRNIPNFNFTEYTVNGYVFNDLNRNNVKDGSEVGIEGATLTLDDYMDQTTDANGFYQFRVPAATYTLKQTPPEGYGIFTNPDSFVVTVSAAVSRSFADTMCAGGWITVTVWQDDNKNGKYDTKDESVLPGVELTVNGDTTTTVSTDEETGIATLFVPKGTFTVSCDVPDSFFCSTTNPITGTMPLNGALTGKFGLYLTDFGTISGKVFIDNNRNGKWDSGEPGVTDVWLGAHQKNKPPLTFDYTDSKGDYSMMVPVNDPPHTTAWVIDCVPSSGYAITSLTIDSLWVQKNQTLTGKNFALGGFYIIRADADRVLSLASGDLYENDWKNQSIATPHRDVDILLGTESAGKDNVMVWLNQYDKKPLIDGRPSYARSAPYWVMAIALDSLDTGTPQRRLDMITGTRYTATGNFFVWINQNTQSNEGYFPTSYTTGYRTTDNGDVQSIVTMNAVGGTAPDIIVGTRSPVPGTGTLEMWTNGEGATPTFTRSQTITNIGEVTSMVLRNLHTGNSSAELIVGTRTGEYNGAVRVYELVSGVWTLRSTLTTASDVINCVAALDIDGDGKMDIAAGTENGLDTGKLMWWKGAPTGTSLSFTLMQQVDASGVVTCMIAGDYGGSGREDIVMGWRKSTNSYTGGVEIWYTDSGQLPASGSDPSGGKVNKFVSAITAGHYDYGVYPVTPPLPYLLDFAVGVKRDQNNGELVVFVR